jgi:hypothetical protein
MSIESRKKAKIRFILAGTGFWFLVLFFEKRRTTGQHRQGAPPHPPPDQIPIRTR